MWGVGWFMGALLPCSQNSVTLEMIHAFAQPQACLTAKSNVRNCDSDSGVRCSLGHGSLRLMRSMPRREGRVQLNITAGGSIMVSGSAAKCNNLFLPCNSILG